MRRTDGYQPLTIVEKLSSLHKDQVFELGNHHEGPPPGGKADSRKRAGHRNLPKGTTANDPGCPRQLLKSFLLVVALSLTLTSSLGIWMAITQTRSRVAAWRLLIAGALIPVGLLLL